MEDIVTVTCYGKTEEMTRKSAKSKYLDCMMCSEGAELNRYANIYAQLLSGCKVCSDEKD